jgi:hypothetical protein
MRRLPSDHLPSSVLPNLYLDKTNLKHQRPSLRLNMHRGATGDHCRLTVKPDVQLPRFYLFVLEAAGSKRLEKLCFV